MSFYSRVIDLQKLNIAWERVRKNKPACGVDNVTWEMFEGDRKSQLKQLHISLADHKYAVMPVKIVTLYKGDKLRDIALYCMRDKVIQQSIANELVKIYDNSFSDCVYAYRPGKSALNAVNMITAQIQKAEPGWVLKLDIAHFFDTISITRLISLLRRKIREEDSLELIKAICNAPGLSASGELVEKRKGMYQGSAIAPVLSNIYLAEIDQILERDCDFYIRYSDDIIILGKSKKELEDMLTKITLLLEKAGLSLNQSKTDIVSVEEGFDFLGYSFNQKGRAIPAGAEAGLEEKLENIWLTDKRITLHDKLRKGAEILEGWEQYFKDDREIASIYEFAIVVYMTQNKGLDFSIMADYRKALHNNNYEICMYLCQFWEKLDDRRMMLYEMEDFFDVVCFDQDIEIEISDTAWEGLIGFFRKMMEGEEEEIWGNIMQIYSDAGAYNKASVCMDRIKRLHNDDGDKGTSGIDDLMNVEKNQDGMEPVYFTKEQIKKYMEIFIGREDTYAVQKLAKNGNQHYEQVMEPLTEEIMGYHFSGEYTVGTYVQRINSTAHFLVIDVDISKKMLLEADGKVESLRRYLHEASIQVKRIQEIIKKMGLKGYVEESGYRGYHIWIFFTEWIPVRYLNMMQGVIEEQLADLPDGVTAEFFPNSFRLKKGKAGQAIKLPYGYHMKTGRQSKFLDDEFNPVSEPGQFIMHMKSYASSTIKKILNTMAPSKSIAVKENMVDMNLSDFGELSKNIEIVLKECNLMRYLCQRARVTGYLTHFERLSILYVFGHMGEEGADFIHNIMSFTLNYQYSITEKFIAKLPEKPISCLKLRDQYQKVTAEFGCNCNFRHIKNCYPSPVLHAIKTGDSMKEGITVPTSRTLPKENEAKLLEELNVSKRVQDIAGKIVELKRQRRGIDKNIMKLEHELEKKFDELGLDCLEIEFGMLVRRKKQQGYEWILEI